MPAPTREDTWLITLSLDGRDMGVWDSKDGGEVDSEESKYKPGGMAAEISLGGSVSIGNLTIKRYCDRERDWPVIKWLAGRSGKGRGTIGITPLDVDGVRAGDPLVYTGTLKQVKFPDIDSTGGDAAQLECEFTIDGQIA
jgi:hypothetical protein